MAGAHIIYGFFLLGIVVEAVSGTLAARNQNIDLMAAVLIGVITALGGGTARDLLLGNFPLLWVGKPALIMLAIGAGICTLLVGKYLIRVPKPILTLDALGLAAFTIVTTEKMIQLEMDPIITSTMAMITAIGGGIMRDLLCNRVPLVFREELYALVALVTSIFYQLLHHFDLEFTGFEFLVLAFCFGTRMLAIKWHIRLPAFAISEER